MALHQSPEKEKHRSLLKRARSKYRSTSHKLCGQRRLVKNKSRFAATDRRVQSVKTRMGKDYLKQYLWLLGNEWDVLSQASQQSDERCAGYARSVTPLLIPEQAPSDDYFSYEQSTNTDARTNTSDVVYTTALSLQGCDTMHLETDHAGSLLSISQGDSFSTAPNLASDIETQSEPEFMQAEYTVDSDLLVGNWDWQQPW
ncbi:uncharacterized protein RCO7_06219 [Rhynchosporium graminicola]|uniref:Uncharacterized protein n=1 Tax=Rhynchosporium graminicola TaxID=2792576 RepID=A0A1E1KYG0_9HELO|nr:uncharacterized protein RCO7_06219 [Rhynchosporium commune]